MAVKKAKPKGKLKKVDKDSPIPGWPATANQKRRLRECKILFKATVTFVEAMALLYQHKQGTLPRDFYED